MDDKIARCWNFKAKQWRVCMGEKGDENRVFNSDPILWKMLGDVKHKVVLDAGCGSGYLSVQIALRGAASVLGIDIAENMIEEARTFASQRGFLIDFRVDSCSELSTVLTSSVDLIVSNYVLMDLPDLHGAAASFFRVLKTNGRAVCIISHPYNSGLAENEMYFDEIRKTHLWPSFDTPFIYFHRPLSRYWQVFRKAGFWIEEFDEPVADHPNIKEKKEKFNDRSANDSRNKSFNEPIKNYRKRPWSVAFHLVKEK